MRLSDHSAVTWIVENNIKVESGLPFDWKNHMFWWEPMRDNNPKQVYCKAAQCGGSTMFNLKLFHLMKRLAINVIYTLPTDSDVNQFVSSKTNRIIAHNQAVAALTTDKDAISQKRVGDSTVYFRGTFTERAALSISADLLIHDEIDRSNRAIVEQYESRLQHSKYQWRWVLSNPSTPGNGCDMYWQLSDRKLWHVKCPHCQVAQVMTYEDNVDVERKEYFCSECGLTLSDETRGNGEWIATGPKDAEWSGYRFSLLFAPWVSAAKIIELKQTKSASYFANFVLGEAYAGTGGNLTEDELFANLNDEPFPLTEPIVIGADLGIPNYYVIGNKYGLFSSGSCNGYDDIEQALKKWPKSICVLDAAGDIWASRQLQDKYPGRVYLTYYRPDRKMMKLVEWGKDGESGKVTVDRNRMIQTLVDEYRAKKIPLRGKREDWQEAWIHFANIYKTTQDDAMGQPRSVWERSGPDHLVHAMVYWRTGMDKWANFTDNYVNPPVQFEPTPSYRIDPITRGVPANEIFVEKEDDDWRKV